MNITDVRSAEVSESLCVQGESTPDFSVAGLRLEFLADNIAIQGELAATFHNARVQAEATLLQHSWTHCVLWWRESGRKFKHSQLCLDSQNNSSLLRAPRCIS